MLQLQVCHFINGKSAEPYLHDGTLVCHNNFLGDVTIVSYSSSIISGAGEGLIQNQRLVSVRDYESSEEDDRKVEIQEAKRLDDHGLVISGGWAN